MRSLAAAFGLTETSPPGPSPDRFDVELLKHPRSVAILLGITVVYFLAGKFGLSLAFLNASASPVWPPTGIALAAMMLMGRQIWPAVLLGAFIVNVTTTGEMFSSLGIALGNTAEAVVGAIFAKRFANGVHAFERPDSVLRYSFFTGMVATAVSATIGTATLLLFQQAEFLNAGLLWMTWWLGDFGGAVIVAPLLILWATQPEIPFRPVRILEGLGVLFIMWLSAHAVFGGVLPARGAPIMYLCIPALVYTAFRFGPRETAT